VVLFLELFDFELELFDFEDEYPSAYHPPPTSLNEQGDIIFLALFLQCGQVMDFVPTDTSLSVTVPELH
jgi:hypothetical protein